jgi:hypothetical protein
MNTISLYMITKVSVIYLFCLTMLCGLFTLSYNFMTVTDNNEIPKTLATSNGDSEGSESSEKSSDDDEKSSDDDEKSSDDDEKSSDDDEKSSDDDEKSIGQTKILSSPQDLDTSDLSSDSNSLGYDSSTSTQDSNANTQSYDDKFQLNSEDIAKELGYLTSSQITSYPIIELSGVELRSTLSFLASHDLAKVFKNIPKQDLLIVKERIGENTFDDLLLTLTSSDIQSIQGRLN